MEEKTFKELLLERKEKRSEEDNHLVNHLAVETMEDIKSYFLNYEHGLITFPDFLDEVRRIISDAQNNLNLILC